MFDFQNPEYPYPSKRNVVYSAKGMVATSQNLAAQAGLDILKKGGNAIDAAVATAACLTVVEPTSNGIGGDAFALVWFNGSLHGLNASGHSPELLTLQALEKRGLKEIPRFGFVPVMVPGIPSAWAELNDRFGKLSLLECLKPAIEYAKNGFPVSKEVATHWQNAFRIYSRHCTSDEFRAWFDTFSFDEEAPAEGQMVKLPDHAETLMLIGKTNSKAFYHGALADKIDGYSRKHDGFIRKADLSSYVPKWVDPIHVNYKGYDVWEIPPNGQGIVALEALKIYSMVDSSGLDETERIHRAIESMKLAFADAYQTVADPGSMNVNPYDLLSPKHLLNRSSLISDTAIDPQDVVPFGSGTVYLATADGDGNMVSYIQSNYMGFGSGLVVPGTGIALQNRGHNFNMTPGHPNCLGPRKQSYHTIIPGFLTKGNRAIGPFGVMGGFMQPQGHLQILLSSIEEGMNPQSALDRPRWQWMEGKKVLVEDSMSEEIIDGLKKKGHDVVVTPRSSTFGRGEIIWKSDSQNAFMGGCESRCDGTVASW